MNTSWPVLLLFGGLLIAIVLVLFWHPQRSQTKTTSTSAERWRTDAVFRDDDRYWYGGLFYNNPDDPALLVPKRFGLGWTVNLGHPQGKLLLISMLLLPLVLAILTFLISGPTPIGCHPSGCHPIP